MTQIGCRATGVAMNPVLILALLAVALPLAAYSQRYYDGEDSAQKGYRHMRESLDRQVGGDRTRRQLKRIEAQNRALLNAQDPAGDDAAERAQIEKQRQPAAERARRAGVAKIIASAFRLMSSDSPVAAELNAFRLYYRHDSADALAAAPTLLALETQGFRSSLLRLNYRDRCCICGMKTWNSRPTGSGCAMNCRVG